MSRTPGVLTRHYYCRVCIILYPRQVGYYSVYFCIFNNIFSICLRTALYCSKKIKLYLGTWDSVGDCHASMHLSLIPRTQEPVIPALTGWRRDKPEACQNSWVSVIQAQSEILSKHNVESYWTRHPSSTPGLHVPCTHMAAYHIHVFIHKHVTYVRVHTHTYTHRNEACLLHITHILTYKDVLSSYLRLLLYKNAR